MKKKRCDWLEHVRCPASQPITLQSIGFGDNYRWPSLPEIENCRSSCLSLQSQEFTAAYLHFATLQLLLFRPQERRLVQKLRSCVKVEVAVLGSPSLTVRTVSVDVKQHRTMNNSNTAQVLWESQGGRPELPVPNKPYGFCGLKAP